MHSVVQLKTEGKKKGEERIDAKDPHTNGRTAFTCRSSIVELHALCSYNERKQVDHLYSMGINYFSMVFFFFFFLFDPVRLSSRGSFSPVKPLQPARQSATFSHRVYSVYIH